MQIKNTVALVTGANRGIGAALVQALLAHGASKVYAAARHEDDLTRLRASRDRRIVPVDLDVTKADHVGRVADQARDVKVLFNNAGVLDFGSVLDASPAAFAKWLPSYPPEPDRKAESPPRESPCPYGPSAQPVATRSSRRARATGAGALRDRRSRRPRGRRTWTRAARGPARAHP